MIRFRITMEDAKEVHSSLRRAAGLVKAVHDRYIGERRHGLSGGFCTLASGDALHV